MLTTVIVNRPLSNFFFYNYSTDRVRQYVKDYLTESTSILAGRQEDQDIYLMIVQCFEVIDCGSKNN